MLPNVYELIQNGSGALAARVHVIRSMDAATNYRQAIKIPLHNVGPTALQQRMANILANAQATLPFGSKSSLRMAIPDQIIGAGGTNRQAGIGTTATYQPYKLLSVRVNDTRQWACNSAVIHYAAPYGDQETIYPPPIRPNDLIIIEAGYTAAPSIRFWDSYFDTDYKLFAGDVLFYGIVDTVKGRGGEGNQTDGLMYTAMARDTMCFLVDNKIRGSYISIANQQFNRAYLIRDMMWLGGAIDQVEWTLPTGGSGEVTLANRQANQYVENGRKVYKTVPRGNENCIFTIGNLEVSGREDFPASTISTFNANMSFMDKYPIEIIRHLSLVESSPRELWADPQTGEIHWMCRRSDMTKLYNPQTRHLRQYFYRFPRERANIISWSNEWSTLATITELTITNPQAHTQNSRDTMDYYVASPFAAMTDPHDGANPLRPLVRCRFVYDDTLGVGSSVDVGAIARSIFQLMGRDIQAGMITVPFDPSLRVGEVVQIFNTDLFGRRQFSPLTSSDWNNPNKPVIPEVNNPSGIFRIEALSHGIAVGGIEKGGRTTLYLTDVDEDTGSPPRLIYDFANQQNGIQVIPIGDANTYAPTYGAPLPNEPPDTTPISANTPL